MVTVTGKIKAGRPVGQVGDGNLTRDALLEWVTCEQLKVANE